MQIYFSLQYTLVDKSYTFLANRIYTIDDVPTQGEVLTATFSANGTIIGHVAYELV